MNLPIIILTLSALLISCGTSGKKRSKNADSVTKKGLETATDSNTETNSNTETQTATSTATATSTTEDLGPHPELDAEQYFYLILYPRINTPKDPTKNACIACHTGEPKQPPILDFDETKRWISQKGSAGGARTETNNKLMDAALGNIEISKDTKHPKKCASPGEAPCGQIKILYKKLYD